MPAEPTGPSKLFEAAQKIKEQEGKEEEEEEEEDYADEGLDPTGFLFALFCLENVPISMIEEVIQTAADELGGSSDPMYHYWLADSYENIPPKSNLAQEGTKLPISPLWRSPFIGKTIEDVARFMEGAPQNRDLDLRHFVVLDKARYMEKGWVTGYKFGHNRTLTSLPLVAKTSTSLLYGYDGYMWKDYVRKWQKKGKVPWS